jgi:hypothetical protein
MFICVVEEFSFFNNGFVKWVYLHTPLAVNQYAQSYHYKCPCKGRSNLPWLVILCHFFLITVSKLFSCEG